MPTPAPFKDISPADLSKGLADGSVALVDVREPAEFAEGHIAGATLNPLSRFDPTQLPKAEQGRQVVLVCRSGKRSVSAMEMARLAGRRDVDTHLPGGVLAWLAENRPVVRD